MHRVKSSRLWFTSYFSCLLNDHHLSFKVPEIPKRRVPEERKPVPAPKTEAPPAKGISTALVKKKEAKPKQIFFLCIIFHVFLHIFRNLLSMCLCFYTISICIIWFCIVSVAQFQFFNCSITYSLNLSQLRPFSFLSCAYYFYLSCVAFSGKCRVFFTLRE